ncbi:MAG: hypothetical protein J5I93_25860, partial [Pirellulaceae bacterium]|nr:hypothetical protein [Pirellulaceae bacterium]
VAAGLIGPLPAAPPAAPLAAPRPRDIGQGVSRPVNVAFDQRSSDPLADARDLLELAIDEIATDVGLRWQSSQR